MTDPNKIANALEACAMIDLSAEDLTAVIAALRAQASWPDDAVKRQLRELWNISANAVTQSFTREEEDAEIRACCRKLKSLFRAPPSDQPTEGDDQ